MPMGCTDAQLAGLRYWASQRTIDEIHVQITGYLGTYPTLCPDSNDIGSYEGYARGYAKGTVDASALCCPPGYSYNGEFCSSGSGEDITPPHLCSLGGIPLDDVPAPYYPPIKQTPYERPEATCEELGSCPSIACPEGKWYRRIPFFDCEEGYSSPEDTGGIFGFTGTGICYCDSDPEAQRKKAKASTEEWKEGELGSLGALMKMLPQLLIVMVIVSIIGAFKK